MDLRLPALASKTPECHFQLPSLVSISVHTVIQEASMFVRKSIEFINCNANIPDTQCLGGYSSSPEYLPML